MDLFKDYADYLCGEHVWGLVIKGADGPIACPCIRQVRNYDMAIRELQHKLMKSGKDFKAALEAAMADPDTRMLTFTTPFSMEAHTQECKALTAPALQEIYAKLPGQRGQKREHEVTYPPPPQVHAADRPISASAKKKLKAKAKAKAVADAAARAAAGSSHLLALKDAPRADKGKGKGKGKLPKGIKTKTEDGKMVCYAYNKGEVCVQNPCGFAHVCWWCHGNHKGGFKKCNGGA